MDDVKLEEIYQEKLEERIINSLAEKYAMDYLSAMRLYYSSKLAEKIHEGRYGIQYLDHKVLIEILADTEADLFTDIKGQTV